MPKEYLTAKRRFNLMLGIATGTIRIEKGRAIIPDFAKIFKMKNVDCKPIESKK